MKLSHEHIKKIASDEAMNYWRFMYGNNGTFQFPSNPLMIEIAMKEFFEAGFIKGMEFLVK